MFFLSTFLVNAFLYKQQHKSRETFCNLAQLEYPKSATTIPKTFQKVTADNFPQWVFSGAKVAELVTHSPNRTRPGTPFLMSAIPGLRSALECRNLISSNSFAHRLGTGNSALRLAPGPVGLKPDGAQNSRSSLCVSTCVCTYHRSTGSARSPESQSTLLCV